MLKKTSGFIILLTIVLTLFTVPLLAAPTAVAADRALLMPTADVSHNQLELEYSYYRGQSILDLTAGLFPRLNVGIRQEFKGNFSAIAKAAILAETENRPGLALGGELSTNGQHVYAVLSKQLGRPGFRGHVGLGTGRYRLGMAGVTLMLNPVRVKSGPGLMFPATTLAAEYDGMGINAGLAFQFSPEFRGYLALIGGHGLGFGFNYKAEF